MSLERMFQAKARMEYLGGEGESSDGEYSRGHGEVPVSLWRDILAHLESPSFGGPGIIF